MYDTFYLSFEGRGYRDHQTTVAHGRCHVLIDNPVRLCRTEDGLQAAGNTAHRDRHFPADLR